ncbi:ribosomal large subunit pseudouridine synthase F [Thraustotheca clavata]|uniref:Ribosomal large subunit pseudouridine synthase F n=1 Tax=Thraustotheca clavata TaxID=74557 RepID=A0A1W0AC13_9STRA|nr:ribosomal large subunit pseudouridine synthase F [Thraustotheca clavata]
MLVYKWLQSCRYSTDVNAVRLSKLMSLKGICSRREADNYIRNGCVRVNGEIVSELGSKVLPSSKIELSRDAHTHLKSKVTVILNKPLNVVSSQPEDGHAPAIKLLTPENEFKDLSVQQPFLLNGPMKLNVARFGPLALPKMAVCGRLDVNSTGLLVFTQDGTLAKKILDPEGGVEKEYLVRVDMNLNPSERSTQTKVQKLRDGIYIDKVLFSAKSVEVINENQLRVILTEGKHRQIRRMCEQVGMKVVALKRVRIGNIKLRTLPVGKWRYLQSFDKI